MLATIDFNDELLLEANKIENVALERNLSAEFEMGELPMTQKLPHGEFCIRRFVPHAPCKAASGFCDVTMVWFLCHRTPHPPSLREGTLSHKGRGKYYTRIGIRT